MKTMLKYNPLHSFQMDDIIFEQELKSLHGKVCGQPYGVGGRWRRLTGTAGAGARFLEL